MRAVAVEDVTGLTPREMGMKIKVLQAEYPHTLFFIECRDNRVTIMRSSAVGSRRR